MTLGSLEYVGGDLYLEGCESLRDIGKLRHVGGFVHIDSQIVESHKAFMQVFTAMRELAESKIEELPRYASYVENLPPVYRNFYEDLL